MNNNFIYLLRQKLVLLVLFISIVPNSAYAQTESLEGVADSIQRLFGFIPNVITLEKLLGQDEAAMFWARFLLWLLIFAGAFYGAGFAFKSGKEANTRIAGTVSFVFATIGALLIPDKIIAGIFQSYGLLAAILIWFVPVIAGFFLVSMIKPRLVKALIYLGMIFMLVAIDASITSSFATDLDDNPWYPFFKLLLAFVIIAFLWNLLFSGIDGWNAAVPGGHGGGGGGGGHDGGGAGGGAGGGHNGGGHNPAPGPNPPGPGPHPPGRRPTGPRPPATPAARNPADPPTPDGVAPPGINPHAPGPRPIPQRLPREPTIPDERQIFIDLSRHFAPIRSQGKLGACTAFAATSIFEYILHVGYQMPINYLSPLFLWYKTRETINAVNDNTGPSNCAVPMQNLVDYGVCFENFWPYVGITDPRWQMHPNQNAVNDAYHKKIMSFRSLDRNDPDQWVHALLKEYPINIGVIFPIDMIKPYRKSLYDNFGARGDAGGHTMVIAGYYSHYPFNGAGIKAFKIRNSHDVDWGENGYTWVPAEVLKSMIFEDPIIIYGWKNEDSDSNGEALESQRLTEQIKKSALEEMEGLSAQKNSLGLLREHLSNGNFEQAFELVQALRRTEEVIGAIESRLEHSLSQLKNKVQEPYKSLVAKAERDLKSHTTRLFNLLSGNEGLYAKLIILAQRELTIRRKQQVITSIGRIIGQCLEAIENIEEDLKKL